MINRNMRDILGMLYIVYYYYYKTQRAVNSFSWGKWVLLKRTVAILEDFRVWDILFSGIIRSKTLV